MLVTRTICFCVHVKKVSSARVQLQVRFSVHAPCKLLKKLEQNLRQAAAPKFAMLVTRTICFCVHVKKVSSARVQLQVRFSVHAPCKLLKKLEQNLRQAAALKFAMLVTRTICFCVHVKKVTSARVQLQVRFSAPANSVFGGAGLRWRPLPKAEVPTEPTGEKSGGTFSQKSP